MNELMSELRLFGMRESLDYRISEAAQANLSHQDFLTFLLEDESLHRKNKRSERLRKRARFNDQALLENFETDSVRGVTKTLIKEFSSLKFLNEKQNIILTGGTGAGKSFLAQAIGHHTCINGYETFFIHSNKLFKEVQAHEVAGNYLNYLQKIKRASLLIIDDLGLRNYTHEEANTLFDILEDRYKKSSTIVTSQVKPEGWKTLFEDPVIAEAIVDRLSSCAHTVHIKGPTWRKKHLPKNKQNSKN